ncbi:hypothetical protein L6452_33179 [Arctium lappa]|uniref:Uncharacterized protein n=1 Tax=Arctium lappa TaxID=4217 RepID=A0ACB8Z5R7_ARCLA|nr:hypothetical protein L6452_33179 [Arctium lappa]
MYRFVWYVCCNIRMYIPYNVLLCGPCCTNVYFVHRWWYVHGASSCGFLLVLVPVAVMVANGDDDCKIANCILLLCKMCCMVHILMVAM